MQSFKYVFKMNICSAELTAEVSFWAFLSKLCFLVHRSTVSVEWGWKGLCHSCCLWHLGKEQAPVLV